MSEYLVSQWKNKDIGEGIDIGALVNYLIEDRDSLKKRLDESQVWVKLRSSVDYEECEFLIVDGKYPLSGKYLQSYIVSFRQGSNVFYCETTAANQPRAEGV